MGFFDFLSGTKRPAAGVAAVPMSDLKKQLLALNRETAPWQIRDGAAEGCTLVAEWKIQDAKWYEIFAKAGSNRWFKMCIKLDEAAHTLSSVDKSVETHFRIGTLDDAGQNNTDVLTSASRVNKDDAEEDGMVGMSFGGSTFSGHTSEKSFGTAYSFKEDGGYGKVYEYHFDTAELKEPILAATLSSGWTYKRGW